jgi:tRNA:m4X modification enzyme
MTNISRVSGEEVQYLLAKLDRAACLLPYSYPLDIPLHDLSRRHTDDTNAPPKHIKQLESLVEHLKAVNLCQPGATFCELGSGVGKLSDHISIALNGVCSHILIDRKQFGHTRLRDRAIAARCRPPYHIKRLTMDIAELESLQSVCEIKEELPVAVSKHLCGPAADLSIDCCRQTGIPLAVATCCHYLCSWESFSGREFFESLGFTENDFKVLTTASQWATMKRSTNNTENAELTNNVNDDLDSGGGWLPSLSEFPRLPLQIELKDLVDSQVFEEMFPREAKIILGKRCKLLVDLARAKHLQARGYRVKLVRYTTLSAEDHLLIAVK